MLESDIEEEGSLINEIILDRDLIEESKYGFLDGSTNAGASKTSSFFLNKLVCDFTSVAAYVM